MRNLSNEVNKIQRHVSDLQINGQQNQNQMFIPNQSKNGSLFNILKGDDSPLNHKISSASSKASTADGSNCNSDVEIIDDDYAKGLQAIPGLQYSKSTIYQTTSDSHNQMPFQL